MFLADFLILTPFFIFAHICWPVNHAWLFKFSTGYNLYNLLK
jgi:hypothetical protein